MQRQQILARVRDLLDRSESIDMSAGELAEAIEAEPLSVGAAFASPMFIAELERAGYQATVSTDVLPGERSPRSLVQVRKR